MKLNRPSSTVREYHSSLYVPHNLCLVVSGASCRIGDLLHTLQTVVEPRILAMSPPPPKAGEWKRPFVETTTKDRVIWPAGSRKEVVRFIESDESVGEIQIGLGDSVARDDWLGTLAVDGASRSTLWIAAPLLTRSPSCLSPPSPAPSTPSLPQLIDNTTSLSAYDVPHRLSCGSAEQGVRRDCRAILHVPRHLREPCLCLGLNKLLIKNLCHSRQTATRVTSNELCISLSDVPAEHLETIDEKVKAALLRIASEGLDMKRMEMVLRRERRQVRSSSLATLDPL